MGLLSIFKSRIDAGAAGSGVSEPVDAVQRARTRARQRLIGAVVLVVTGVAVFPLVFESQPRPVPVDIPIEIPRKEGAPALVMPAARLPAPGAAGVAPGLGGNAAAGATTGQVARANQSGGTAPALASTSASAPAPVPAINPSLRDHDAVITELREESGHSAGVAGAGGVASTASSVSPSTAVKPHRVASAPVAPVAPVVPKISGSAVTVLAKPTPPVHAALTDGARAKALLEGIDSAPLSALRFVVQIGAFADASAARETRLKVDKLGLKTYTQSAQTPAGPRIRVRVGPFATRDEALKAQDRARSAGLSAVVLAL